MSGAGRPHPSHSSAASGPLPSPRGRGKEARTHRKGEGELEAILALPKPDATELPGRLRALDALLPQRGDPADAAALLTMLRLLYRVARADLPLARLFEGHVDAGQICARFAPDPGRGDGVPDDALLGVWGAALPGEPLRIEGDALWGGKAFASGAGVLTHALAGADTPEGNRLVLIDLRESPPAIDRSWWRTTGMQRSETHLVRWAGARGFRFVGKPGDYAREPWFGGGALRFVAAHAGGTAALFDRVRDHLVAQGRAADPHQAGRLARLYGLAESAAAAVRSAAAFWRVDDAGYPVRVAAARMQVAEAAGRAILLAEEAVGVSGMFVDHPLSAALADLQVYLRQPAPDAAAMRVGAAAASGALVPEL